MRLSLSKNIAPKCYNFLKKKKKTKIIIKMENLLRKKIQRNASDALCVSIVIRFCFSMESLIDFLKNFVTNSWLKSTLDYRNQCEPILFEFIYVFHLQIAIFWTSFFLVPIQWMQANRFQCHLSRVYIPYIGEQQCTHSEWNMRKTILNV